MYNLFIAFALAFTFLNLIAFICLSYTYAKNALHMFQQNNYELYRYTKWLFSKNNLHFSLTPIYLIVLLLLDMFLDYFNATIIGVFVSIGFALYLIIKESKREYVKPLVVTARVVRQIIVYSLLMIGLIYFVILYTPTALAATLTVIFSYLMIYIMAIITMPIEYLIKKHYENDARRKLDKINSLIKVGVTGSYGKTSTKNIVNDIISDSFYTLITPRSYNTPMGVTRTIRENLKPIHEVFVCEMGADKVNDISYLMDFVKPKYGIVTSIGPQHLNTFKSLDNIINEKMQEIEMLPLDGVGFINLDNEYIANYKIKNKCKVVSVGINNTDADYVAKNIKTTKDGTSFTLTISKKKYKFNTSLLGIHNVTNILIGIALAIELGIEVKEIVKAVSRIGQIEHRLEVKNINGFTFIDDAFNSNPVGSKMAADVLSLMPKKRVIVTPGMIDLGDKQYEINYEYGKYFASKVDFVILVGVKQTEPILKGLNEEGFNSKNIKVFATVKEAFNFIYSNFSSKDTILLENDLPDAFNI